VLVPEITETTAVGAAYLAGVSSGYWETEEIGGMWSEAARYEPSMDDAERERLLGRWREAVSRSTGWAA
jgi:glycerol kinase